MSLTGRVKCSFDKIIAELNVNSNLIYYLVSIITTVFQLVFVIISPLVEFSREKNRNKLCLWSNEKKTGMNRINH